MERVKVINLSKNFGNHSLFHDTNFSLLAGEIVGLSGKNGVGKTTFIKLLCGLIYPDSGQIFINGVDIRKNRTKWMEDVGTLLEGSRSLHWRLSAFQNFIYFAGLKKIFGRKAIIQADKFLKLFDLWDVKCKKVETFSFGMKQRLALACSVAHSPSIVLLDEPTSGLDAISSEILENYIKLLSEENKTVLLASHDHEMIHRLSTKKLKIENGVINHDF